MSETRDVTGWHLIEVSGYGSAYYRGVVVKETAQSYMVAMRGDRPRVKRKASLDVLLPPSADVVVAMARYETAYRSFRDEVTAAETALQAVRKRRNDAAVAALSEART